jgi:hypothetical protein
MATRTRRSLIVVTALFQIIVGAAVLLTVVLLGVGLGLGGWAALLWVVPTLAVTWRAVRSRKPALVEDEDTWTEYVLRAVLIGSGRVRPVGVRLVTGLVLGGPLAVFVVVAVVVEFVALSGI